MAQSLFGLTPEQIQEARRLQQQQSINQQAQSLGMFGPLYAAGRGLAQTGIGQLAGLFPQTDPMLQQATTTQSILRKYQGQNFNDPSVLSKIAGEFSAVGQPEIAMQLGEQARALTPKVTRTVVAPGSSVVDEQGKVLFTAPKEDKEAIVKTPANFAAAAQELGFGVKTNLSDYSQQEAQAVNNLLQTRGESVQAAGKPAPPSGRVPVTDLKTATELVDRFTKGPQEKLSTARDARSQLILAKKGEGAAFAQLRRQLVKLVGDSQIGMGEVRDALGSAGIVGDTISAVNQFMTGVPTADKLDSVEKVIDALEQINAQSYNQGIVRARNVLTEGALAPKTIDSLVPPEYKLRKKPSEKSSQFQTGKVYRDANGNRAKYLGNGKWEPIQ